MIRASAILLTIALVAAPAARAQGLVDAVVDGDKVTAGISLPGGIAADLTITFEEAVGLSLASLGLSAELVSPTNLGLLSRLPVVGGLSIPVGFPVLLRIEPAAGSGLSFSGIVSIELHTHNLGFKAGCPLRLFAASAGGPFTDITVSMGTGSYRVRGDKGGFSDFLIVADLRLVDTVIRGKFDRLEDLLAAYEEQIDQTVYEDLADLLHAARTSYGNGALIGSIKTVEAFIAKVERESGENVPDVWRPSGEVVNAAGYLRAAASTLRFSLVLKSNSAL